MWKLHPPYVFFNKDVLAVDVSDSLIRCVNIPQSTMVWKERCADYFSKNRDGKTENDGKK